MKFTSKMLATSVITAASAAGLALGLSATAAAEPAAPAPAPTLPGLPFLQQLATNPAAASQLMQGLTSVLSGAQAAAPAAAPRHTRAGRNRVGHSSAACSPAAAPAAAARPAAAAAPATAPQNLIPSGEMNVPNVPFLPVPLPQQLSFPGDLAALMPSGLIPAATPAAAPAAAAPAAAAPPLPAAAAPAPAAAPPPPRHPRRHPAQVWRRW